MPLDVYLLSVVAGFPLPSTVSVTKVSQRLAADEKPPPLVPSLSSESKAFKP